MRIGTERKIMANLYVALVHYPVVNKNGDIIASAVTNLDLHDISRAAKTYGVSAFFVVTPLSDQEILVDRILSHWVDGYGAQYNPIRRQALGLIRVTASLKDAVDRIAERDGQSPRLIATSASRRAGCISYRSCRELIGGDVPCLLLFGTAWGLSGDLVDGVDHILEPITGRGEYNHLSVRSAVSVILDRLTVKIS